MKRYEAMFLFDTAVSRDWETTVQEVQRLLDRIGAELLVCVKFDERKLAYELNKRKRGMYVLTYFEAPPERITDLERDVRLSELLLRVLVLRAENLTEERLAELRAHPADTPLAPMTGDGRRHDDDRRPHDRRPGRDRFSDGGGDRPDRGAGERRPAPAPAPVPSSAPAAPAETASDAGTPAPAPEPVPDKAPAEEPGGAPAAGADVSPAVPPKEETEA